MCYLVCIHFFVAYSPHIIKHPDNQTVDIYTSTSLECRAKLYGSTQIHWKKEGSSRLPATATISTNISNDIISSILKIDEIISYYSGDYYCAVSNEIGEVNSSQAHLHVNSMYYNHCHCVCVCAWGCEVYAFVHVHVCVFVCVCLTLWLLTLKW